MFLGTAIDEPSLAQAEQLTHVYRLNEPALSELALEPLLDELLTRIQEILAVDTVAILLLSDEGDELIARAAKGLEEEVEQGVRIPIGRGFAGRIASERVPIYIADVDHADILNPILRAKGIRTMLGVPLITEGNLLGVLHVGTLHPRTFTNEDAAVLQLAGVRAAPAIERARLFDALEREHRGAIILQRSLLPGQLPELVGISVAGRYFAARGGVGGDWYDVIELPHGKVGVAIGDVVGHGVRAATLMGQLRTALRAYSLDGYEPGEVLERLDRLLESIRGRGMATASYAMFDPDNGKLRFASAGHPPPAITAAGGDARLVEISPGPPLGAGSYTRFPEKEEMLNEGEVFLLFTDGLVEVRGEPLDAGFERLLDALCGASSAEQTCEQIVRRLVPREGAQDDIAFVALQNAPIPRELLMRLPAEPSALVQVRRALRRWLRARGAADEDIELITLACGEACSNAVQHAYSPAPASFELKGNAYDGEIELRVTDVGHWRTPRGVNGGRGLTIIESVMDTVEVNATDRGTEVLMRRGLTK